MNVRYANIWICFAAWVAIEVAMSAVYWQFGWFPHRTLMDRIAEDIKIAFFLGVCWLWLRPSRAPKRVTTD